MNYIVTIFRTGMGIALLMTSSLTTLARPVPDYLRCEYLVNPLGIDSDRPRFTWLLQDNRYGAEQQAYQLVVGTDSSSVALGKGNTWDSEKRHSALMLAAYEGPPLKAFTKYYWAVRIWDKDHVERASYVASFETGMRRSDNWKGMWISDGHGHKGRDINFKPAGMFRKEFSLGKPIHSARAYIAVAGLYELFINGKRVGDQRLDPMFTRFDRRNLYVTYDITSYLQAGKNAVGVLLGNGWYNHQSITKDWHFDGAPWRNRPAFCMDLRLSYEGGTTEVVQTDNSWKTDTSPVVFNSIYTAEHYDARLEQSGWDRVGFDDARWQPALYRAGPSQKIVSQQLHPIRNVEKIPVKRFRKINDSLYVFELERNIAGVTELTVAGERGTTVRVKHGESLGADGRVDLSLLDVYYRPVDSTDPFQTDIFTLKGGPAETFMPRFNYKGFQFVEISSSKPIALSETSLAAWFMHSDVPSIGTMHTSDSIINKIWNAARYSYLSNLFGIPTDCPQREKNGWTGDTNIAIELGLFNFDAITIYEKWLADHRDEQQANGVLPAIIPTSGWGYEWANGPDWTGTIATVPWSIYMFYGDSRLLADCYDNIKRYVDHITDIAPTGLTNWGLGDWVPVRSVTPVEYTSSIYYYTCTAILAKAAEIFGRESDYRQYAALAAKIKNAINDKYLSVETGVYGKGLQTEQSVALQQGVVPEGLEAKVAAQLVTRVAADGNKIDVGLLGSKALLNALSENGYGDLAFTIASQDKFPSWGWWMVNGATTLYENWDVHAPKDLSKNHMMFGEIGAWFFKALGGIHPDPDNPGFKNIILRPVFAKGLRHASFSFQSPFGLIVSNWKQSKRTIYYDLTVPANTSATFYLQKGMEIAWITAEGKKALQLLSDGDAVPLRAGRYHMKIIRKN